MASAWLSSFTLGVSDVTERAELGEPLRYSATVEVRPSIVATGYTSLAVERPLRTITDADVDRFLDGMRQQQARLVPIAARRVAQRGDIATADYEARIGARVVGRGAQRLVEVSCSDGDGVAVGLKEEVGEDGDGGLALDDGLRGGELAQEFGESLVLRYCVKS